MGGHVNVVRAQGLKQTVPKLLCKHGYSLKPFMPPDRAPATLLAVHIMLFLLSFFLFFSFRVPVFSRSSVCWGLCSSHLMLFHCPSIHTHRKGHASVTMISLKSNHPYH